MDGIVLPAGTKRSRDEAMDEDFTYERFGKKIRPISDDSTSWLKDSVMGTPSNSSQLEMRSKYDSDDQSSLMSEPGSPQDVEMLADDEPMQGLTLSKRGRASPSNLWPQQTRQNHRLPTPIQPPRLRQGILQHIRDRHPQEISSSEHLEVPSPIDEDEVPTPPSAAEAASSQLSMLNVNDMDIEATEPRLPAISIDLTPDLVMGMEMSREPGLIATSSSSAYMDHTDGSPHAIEVIRQRKRSGALSSGNSPVRTVAVIGSAGGPSEGRKRGFSMGYRADCEKCRMRVPGHMNHFIEQC